MRLRIDSDGTVLGTRVSDGQGIPIAGVKKVTWEMDVATGRATATIVLHDVRLRAPAEGNVAYEPLPLGDDEIEEGMGMEEHRTFRQWLRAWWSVGAS